jgi:hypothetical protein
MDDAPFHKTNLKSSNSRQILHVKSVRSADSARCNAYVTGPVQHQGIGSNMAKVSRFIRV